MVKRRTEREARVPERGAAMVEMAIIVPLLLMLVFGIIEFGIAFNANISVTHAAREGVRHYVVNQDGPGAIVVAKDSANSLDWTQPGVTLAASGCDSDSEFGGPATVSITYPFEFNIPFVPLAPIQLSAEGVMKCGG